MQTLFDVHSKFNQGTAIEFYSAVRRKSPYQYGRTRRTTDWSS